MSDTSHRGYISVYPTHGRGGGTSSTNLIAGAAVHEYGHAIDRYIGGGGKWASDSEEFRTAFNADAGKGRDKLGYFGDTPREAFAEIFAVTLGNAKARDFNTAKLEKHVPNMVAAVRKIVIDYKDANK